MLNHIVQYRATIVRCKRARPSSQKTNDTLIATRCIEDGLTLRHADKDFLPFAEDLGLKVAYSET
jgi:predicted nucleic acid-binding protein